MSVRSSLQAALLGRRRRRLLLELGARLLPTTRGHGAALRVREAAPRLERIWSRFERRWSGRPGRRRDDARCDPRRRRVRRGRGRPELRGAPHHADFVRQPGAADGAPRQDRESTLAPGASPTIAAPSGWNYYAIDGAMCRDGSPVGIYVRYGTVPLMIYLEGGGACMSLTRDHNPPNMKPGFSQGSLNGESFGGSLVTQSGLQAPYTDGIFDNTNPANPFHNWESGLRPVLHGRRPLRNERQRPAPVSDQSLPDQHLALRRVPEHAEVRRPAGPDVPLRRPCGP